MLVDKALVDSIVSKTMNGRVHKAGVSFLMSFEDLYQLLNAEETNYVQELLTQKPSDFGNKEQFKGIDPVPSNMVPIAGQKVTYDGKENMVETQYLPKHVYAAYVQLRKSYVADTGRDIFVGSGYRSPANQAVNFIKWLKYYDYDFVKTLSFVSIPGYSEHSSAEHTAIDFINQDGIECFDTPPFGNFEETSEFLWLQKHAGGYGFVLTCPKGNEMGFSYEPWHWQYQG